jgi:hypothetical protein
MFVILIDGGTRAQRLSTAQSKPALSLAEEDPYLTRRPVPAVGVLRLRKPIASRSVSFAQDDRDEIKNLTEEF